MTYINGRPLIEVAVAHAIRTLRLDANLSQTQLGDRCGVPRERISVIESGRMGSTMETITKVAEALGHRPSDIIALAERLAPTIKI